MFGDNTVIDTKVQEKTFHHVWTVQHSKAINSPRIATTSSSWMTSKDPDTTKQRLSTLSPAWYMRSPGAQWIVWNSIARARRHPSLANRKAGCSLNTFRLRWTQISALMSLGHICNTWRGEGGWGEIKEIKWEKLSLILLYNKTIPLEANPTYVITSVSKHKTKANGVNLWAQTMPNWNGQQPQKCSLQRG